MPHHHDLVGDRPHRREVVGDEHVGELEFLLQPVEQLEDAFGDQLIERRGHLVADDEIGVRGERAGDADALLLAARHLRRQPVDVFAAGRVRSLPAAGGCGASRSRPLRPR